MSRKPESELGISPDNRSKCKTCGDSITKNTPRISVFTKSDWSDGFDKRFVHHSCVNKRWDARVELDKVHLLKMMHPDDLAEMKEAPVSFSPAEKKYSEAFWELREGLDDALKDEHLQSILKENDLYCPEKRRDIWLHLIVNGCLGGRVPKCPSCNTHSLLFYGEQYECAGYLSAVTRCPYKVSTPMNHEEFRIPPEIAALKFFAKWKSPSPLVKVGASASGQAGSAVIQSDPHAPSEDEDETSVPKGQELAGMVFMLAGSFETDRSELEDLIASHGGEVVATPDDATHVLSTPEEIAKKKKTVKMAKALKMELPVLPEEFVLNLAERKGLGLKLRQRKHQSTLRLGGGEGAKLPPVNVLLKRKQDTSGDDADGPATKKAKVRPTPRPGSQILKIDQFAGVSKGNIYVDESNLVYNVTLNQTDISTGVNKFYIIQLIEKEPKKSYTLFTRWGRVGDNSGQMYGNYWGSKPSYQSASFKTPDTGIAAFAEKFKKCTGNNWSDVDNFKPQPGRYGMLILEGQEEVEETSVPAQAAAPAPEPEAAEPPKKKGRTKGGKSAKAAEEQAGPAAPPLPAAGPILSKLDPKVRNFVHMIFDQDMMRKHMAEENIDLRRMPLGTLSKSQMANGYGVLKEILDILDGVRPCLDDNHKNVLLLDASNRYYNIIPHQFPAGSPPMVIKTKDLLKRKLDLMESLMEIAQANKLMKDSEAQTTVHVDDANYASLKCNLTPVDLDGEEGEMVREYVKNTHAKTHSGYSLEVEAVFRAEREGEAERFKKYESLHNKKLLWHGSRLTNWVGILSQGLRIAPPEAPVTGYMFDKGVYFADMVSKSANYCATSHSNPTGVLLLCEVALGDQYERGSSDSSACSNTRAAGKHSCFGVGQTAPDPSHTKTVFDDVTVPLGPGIKNPHKLAEKSSLLYNEFIVYDVAQIQCRYVIQMKFNYR